MKRPRGFLCCSVCSAASSGSENCLRLRRLCGGGVKKKKEKKKKCLQRNVLKLCTVRSRRTRDQWAPCPISKKLVTPSFPGTRSTSAFCQSFPERCVQVCRVLRWCCCNCSRAYVLFLGQAPPPLPPRPTFVLPIATPARRIVFAFISDSYANDTSTPHSQEDKINPPVMFYFRGSSGERIRSLLEP